MDLALKKQIISELDNLPDKKGYSLLDYLRFLKEDQENYYPNKETISAIEEVLENSNSLQPYDSAESLFKDLGIDT